MSQNIKLEKTALLIMDYQNTIISNYLSNEEANFVLANTAELLNIARKSNMLVIYVSVGFRLGYPEVNSKNKVFSYIKDCGIFLRDKYGTGIHKFIKPQKEEPIIIKNRIGAFSGTELDMILRVNNIETLLLAGLTTTGVILSTLRQAFDLDYRIVVLSDCCADPDKVAHNTLLENIFPLHAEVLNVKEVISSLN